MAGNASAHAALQSMIDRLRKVQKIDTTAAPAVAEAVADDARRTIGAGIGPDGTPWAPLKATGGRALVNAAEALTVKAIGSLVLMQLSGPEARHHRGFARGGVARQIIPTRGIPDPMIRAIRKVLAVQFRDVMRGDRG